MSNAKLGAAIVIGTAIVADCVLPASAQPAYRIAAARGATTALALQAPPNARCELAAMSPRGKGSLTAFSDARGIVRYAVTTRAGARGGVLATLECRNATAHTLAGLTLVAGQAPVAAAQTPRAWPATQAELQTAATLGVLPGTPAGFDVTRASDAQLAQLHYPARPDSALAPTSYALWRKLVTTPDMYVSPGVIVNPNVGESSQPRPAAAPRRLMPQTTYHSPYTALQESGVSIIETASPIQTMSGAWHVPSVKIGGASLLEYSQTWVGIEGTTTSHVDQTAQAGTEQDVFDLVFFAFTSYNAWYAFGGQQHVLSNIPVAAGDYVVAETNIDYSNPNTPVADFWVIDLTSGHGTQFAQTLSSNSGSQFFGYAADWIEGRPVVNGVLNSMPYYNGVDIQYVSAITADRKNVIYADGSSNTGVTDVQSNITMTGDGTPAGQPLSACGYGVGDVYCYFL
jgi:hypothetical protein